MDAAIRTAEQHERPSITKESVTSFQALLVAAGVTYCEHAGIPVSEFLSYLSEACAQAAEEYSEHDGECRSDGLRGYRLIKSNACEVFEDDGVAPTPAELSRALMAMVLSGLCQELAQSIPDAKKGESPSPLAIATDLTRMLLDPPDVERHPHSVLRMGLMSSLDHVSELATASESLVSREDHEAGWEDPSRAFIDVRMLPLITDAEGPFVMFYTDGMKERGFPELVFFGGLAADDDIEVQAAQVSLITSVLAKSALDVIDSLAEDEDELEKKVLVSQWGVHHPHLVNLDQFIGMEPEFYRDLSRSDDVMKIIRAVADEKGDVIVLTVCTVGTASLTFLQSADDEANPALQHPSGSKSNLH